MPGGVGSSAGSLGGRARGVPRGRDFQVRCLRLAVISPVAGCSVSRHPRRWMLETRKSTKDLEKVAATPRGRPLRRTARYKHVFWTS